MGYPEWGRWTVLLYASIFLAFLGLVSVFWLGFMGSDDATYARGAYGWIEEFPYVGGHGTFRYTLTIPMAASFLALGGSEVSAAVPSMMYALILLWLLLANVGRFVNDRMLLIAGLLFITSPLLVIGASMPSVDIVEACFVFASLTCFLRAIEAPDKVRLLAMAGIFAALGFLTRETTVFLLAFYGVLFLFGFGIARKLYWVMAFGFIGVWLVEVCYFFAMTGDPLYRINISMNHDSTIDRSIDLAGNISVSEIVDPLLVIFVNQEFGLLFWIAVPLIVWFYFNRHLSGSQRNFYIVFAGLAATWFVCIGFATSLLPLNPRYFLVAAIAATAVSILAIEKMFAQGARKSILALCLAGMIVAGNLAGLYVENRNFNFGFHQLAEWTVDAQEPIYTDPDTFRRIKYLLRWHGVERLVKTGIPPRGSLYFYNPSRVDEKPANAGAWEIVNQALPEPKYVARWLNGTNLWDALPYSARSVFQGGHEEVMLYRVLQSEEEVE